MSFEYDGLQLYHNIERGLLSCDPIRRMEWNNDIKVLQQLPLNAHLLLLKGTEHNCNYYTRIFNMPALEGTLAQCRCQFEPKSSITDAFLQITIGLQAMHKFGIIHQNLNDNVIWVMRSNQYLCGYLLVIGGFSKSGRRVLGQSLLNPTRPEPMWDVLALHRLGLSYDIPNWPLKNSLINYRAWLWMCTVSSRVKPSELLLSILDEFKDRFAVAKRLHYVFRCAKFEFRLIGEPNAALHPSDAELLAMAVELQERAENDEAAAQKYYKGIYEILNLVLWETNDYDEIKALQNAIAQKRNIE